MSDRVRLIFARTEQDLLHIRELFLEYARSLDFSLCFQGFDREIAELPGAYGVPGGDLLLAMVDDGVAGCVGFRPLADGACEMKRLWVRPGFRGLKIGRRLAEAILSLAEQRGYRVMRLDTISTMAAATALYRSLGFTEIDPYYPNPLPGVLYFERML